MVGECYNCILLRLPRTSYYSRCLPPSPTVSRRLPLSTTPLDFTPQPPSQDNKLWSQNLLAFLWLCAICGITCDAIVPASPTKKRFSLCLYLAMGWSVSLCSSDLYEGEQGARVELGGVRAGASEGEATGSNPPPICPPTHRPTDPLTRIRIHPRTHSLTHPSHPLSPAQASALPRTCRRRRVHCGCSIFRHES